MVAAGKLHELIPGKPIVLPQRWLLNAAALAGSAVMTGFSEHPREFWGIAVKNRWFGMYNPGKSNFYIEDLEVPT